MGANYNCTIVKDQTTTDLAATWERIVEQDLYNHGHSGYSGTFAEKRGLVTLEQDFLTEQEAENYIVDHNEKWEPAMATRIVIKGGYAWYIGGWCSS